MLRMRRQGRLGNDGLEILELAQVAEIERVGRCGLGDTNARTLRNQPEFEHHVEALAQSADVAQIPAGNDHPIGNFPVKLLHHFDGDGLLSLDAQAVHAVG